MKNGLKINFLFANFFQFPFLQSSEEWKTSTKLEALGSMEGELAQLLSTSKTEKLEHYKAELSGFRNLFARFLRAKPHVDWSKIETLPDGSIRPYNRVSPYQFITSSMLFFPARQGRKQGSDRRPTPKTCRRQTERRTRNFDGMQGTKVGDLCEKRPDFPRLDDAADSGKNKRKLRNIPGFSDAQQDVRSRRAARPHELVQHQRGHPEGAEEVRERQGQRAHVLTIAIPAYQQGDPSAGGQVAGRRGQRVLVPTGSR